MKNPLDEKSSRGFFGMAGMSRYAAEALCKYSILGSITIFDYDYYEVVSIERDSHSNSKWLYLRVCIF